MLCVFVIPGGLGPNEKMRGVNYDYYYLENSDIEVSKRI